MRILHVIDTLNQTSGGPPRVAMGLCRALAKLGHQVTLVAGGLKGWSNRDLRLDFENGGALRVIGSTDSDPLYALGTRLMAGHDIGHIHTIWNPMLTSLARQFSRQGIPYVVTPHGYLDVWPMQQKALKKRAYLALFERRTLDSARALHLLTTNELEGTRRLGLHCKYFILPNGVDPDEWANLPSVGAYRSLHPEIGDRTLVVFMARLHHGKGADLLAKAFISIAGEFPDSFLVLAGPDYGIRKQLDGLITESGYGDRILLPGMVVGEERRKLLRDADVFALPSHQEGHPMSVVEAAYLGKALLITPQCHCPELTAGIAAEVVAPTLEAVAGGLRRLLSDGAYRHSLARMASKIAREKYDWATIARHLAVHYQTALQSPVDLHNM